jgi:hypothetical protein
MKVGATFGPPTNISLTPTMQKALEESARKTKADVESYRQKYSNRSKPAVPSKEDVPVMGIRSNKNFITSNAVEAILQGKVLFYFFLFPTSYFCLPF